MATRCHTIGTHGDNDGHLLGDGRTLSNLVCCFKRRAGDSNPEGLAPAGFQDSSPRSQTLAHLRIGLSDHNLRKMRAGACNGLKRNGWMWTRPRTWPSVGSPRLIAPEMPSQARQFLCNFDRKLRGEDFDAALLLILLGGANDLSPRAFSRRSGLTSAFTRCAQGQCSPFEAAA